jgi:hypothetical protein
VFSFKRGGIDRWYKKEVKKLNDSYFSFLQNPGDGNHSDAQSANTKSRELETALASLKADYLKQLEAIGQKPRSDFGSQE